MTCEVCGVVLVEQRMPMSLRWGGRSATDWIPEDVQTFLVHPFGKPCTGDAA